MKALKLDNRYFRYPENCTSLEQFVRMVNEGSPMRFIPMLEYLHDHCKEPYFIKSETSFSYINMSRIDTISEVEISVFSKEEYKRGLELVIQDHCLDCALYREDKFMDDVFYYGTTISLDGDCALKTSIGDS